ncbi:MAG: N-acetyltransferase [Deltaproteobacteria bacterium]|nr:N-acetyltransferase [Deltaproteobacteria bacterium]
MNSVFIRKAIIGDVKHIHKLLNHYAALGLLLPRPLSELYDHLRDFNVLVEDGGTEKILGACALGICWEDLAEIRSLAVSEDLRGNKYGRLLVEACLKEARSLGLRKVFALTYAEAFFLRMGFRVVEKSTLPHKVWGDCLKCPKFPECDETAMVLDI